MDARVLGVLDGLPAGVDVCGDGAGEAGDGGAAHLLRDLGDGLEVAGRGSRESGLDEVDAHPLEGAGDLELLLDVQRDAGRLLAVAQGRIEDQYFVLSCHCSQPPASARDAVIVEGDRGRPLAVPGRPSSDYLGEGRLRLRLSLIARISRLRMFPAHDCYASCSTGVESCRADISARTFGSRMLPAGSEPSSRNICSSPPGTDSTSARPPPGLPARTCDVPRGT